MEFTNFPPCRFRFGCVECRNNPGFQEHMKERFGEWECPEGIPLNTPLDKMPDHIQEKIKNYVDKMQKKGQSVPVYTDKAAEPIAKVTQQEEVNRIRKPREFTDTAQCKFRSVCNECRNNEGFRNKIEERFGEWECPEGIPINTPIKNMPLRIQDNHTRKKNQITAQNTKTLKVKEAINAIEELLPEDALYLVDQVRYYVFPHEKSSDLCVNRGINIKVKKTCCGGKVKEVDGFTCDVYGEAESKKCLTCKDFKRARE